MRKWLHRRGIHALCRVQRRVFPAMQWHIVGKNGERIDVTDYSLPRTEVAHY